MNKFTKCAIEQRRGQMRMKMLETCISFPCSDASLNVKKVASSMSQWDTNCRTDLSFSVG